MLSLGIVGLPNVGKSTLFNALTKNNVLAANYPFATIEPNVGIVPLPDSRLTKLQQLYDAQKVVPATVTFVDIAGLVRGASTGQGLGNKFLANIRESNAIVQVVRAFADQNVMHVDGQPDPTRDIETINTELILADLQTLANRIGKLESDVKKDAKTFGPILETAKRAKELLNNGHILHNSGINIDHIRDLQLLTAKPFIYVFNVDEADLSNHDLRSRFEKITGTGPAIFLDAKIEAEISDLSDVDAHELLASLGQSQSGLDQLATIGFGTLGLQTFLTAGPKEVRAWTIPIGATAPQAAGTIHTDFERGFIKAEIVSYDDLITAGSLAAARNAGKARIEGKEYVMQDGDVVEFRFNV